MRQSKKRALSVAMSVLIFAGPFMAATPAYADAKLEQIQTKKEEQANTNAKTFKERMAEAANKVSNMEEGEAYVPGGTQLNVELVNELTSKKARKGDFIRFKMLDNLILNNVVNYSGRYRSRGHGYGCNQLRTIRTCRQIDSKYR